MDDPTPEDYKIKQDTGAIRPRIVIRYPNMDFVTTVKLSENGSLHKQIEKKRTPNWTADDSCANCDDSIQQVKGKTPPCGDCWETALDAAEE